LRQSLDLSVLPAQREGQFDVGRSSSLVALFGWGFLVLLTSIGDIDYAQLTSFYGPMTSSSLDKPRGASPQVQFYLI
jgi:hypothetical protein